MYLVVAEQRFYDACARLSRNIFLHLQTVKLLHNVLSSLLSLFSVIMLFLKSSANCVNLLSKHQTTVFSRIAKEKKGGKKEWYSEYKRPHHFIQRHSTSFALLTQTCSESKADGKQHTHRSSMLC